MLTLSVFLSEVESGRLYIFLQANMIHANYTYVYNTISLIVSGMRLILIKFYFSLRVCVCGKGVTSHAAVSVYHHYNDLIQPPPHTHTPEAMALQLGMWDQLFGRINVSIYCGDIKHHLDFKWTSTKWWCKLYTHTHTQANACPNSFTWHHYDHGMHLFNTLFMSPKHTHWEGFD